MKRIVITLLAAMSFSTTFAASLNQKQTELLNEKVKDYDYVGNFSDNRALVTKGNKSGFINKSGDVVIPLQYENVNKEGMFRNGLWFDYKVGVTDTMGRNLVPQGKVLSIMCYPNGSFTDINNASVYKPTAVVQIETEPGKYTSYCFENGKLLFTLSNDSPIVNPNTGEFLSTTKKGKKEYVGIEALKKQGFDYCRNGMAIPVGEYLIMNKNNKYGLVDMNFNVLYPFERDNMDIQYVDGAVLLTNVFVRDGETGRESYPISTTLYKGGKLVADNLDCLPSVYGKNIYFRGTDIEDAKKYLGIDLPASVGQRKVLTSNGKELKNISVGNKRLKLLDTQAAATWMFEDAKGNALINEPVAVSIFGNKVAVVESEASTNSNKLIYIDFATGDTVWVPESESINLFYYVENGLLKLSDRKKYDLDNFNSLCSYTKDLSKKDNELNLKFRKREDYSVSTKKYFNKLVILENGTSINKEFQDIKTFSDELLRVKYNNRWYFLNDKGEGIK